MISGNHGLKRWMMRKGEEIMGESRKRQLQLPAPSSNDPAATLARRSTELLACERSAQSEEGGGSLELRRAARPMPPLGSSKLTQPHIAMHIQAETTRHFNVNSTSYAHPSPHPRAPP